MKLVETDGKDYVAMDDCCNRRSFYNDAEHYYNKDRFASKGVAGAALGLGIAGTALWLLGGGLNGTSLFGRGFGNGYGVGSGAVAGLAAGEIMNNRDTQYVERKQCADFVQMVNDMWQHSYNQQNQRFSDRETINAEMFSMYKGTRDGFDAINAKHNADAFSLYKYSRDSKDELSAQIGALATEVAVLKAVRPYQDALIQCDIRRTAEHADFNLARRTCRMIEGQVVLPSTPTVTGYASSTCCNRAINGTTPAA